MSTHEFEHIEKLFEEAKAFNKKWNLRVIGSVVVTLLLFMFAAGVKYEDWQGWRRTTDTNVSELKNWKNGLEVNNLKITKSK